MKKFEFNENGVCVNPNIIFCTTANNKNNTYSSPHFSISTAEVDGGWIYGRDYNLINSGGGYAASKDFGEKYPTEKEAVKAAAEDIKEHIMDYVKWKGAKEPSYLESKLIGLADDIIHPKPVELNLF